MKEEKRLSVAITEKGISVEAVGGVYFIRGAIAEMRRHLHIVEREIIERHDKENQEEK